jgi:hypothetical protein
VSAKTPTIYANVVTVRATSSELILDFGVVVDPPENISGPASFDPDIRIILAVSATQKLGELLLNAAANQLQLTTKQVAAETK